MRLIAWNIAAQEAHWHELALDERAAWCLLPLVVLAATVQSLHRAVRTERGDSE